MYLVFDLDLISVASENLQPIIVMDSIKKSSCQSELDVTGKTIEFETINHFLRRRNSD